MKENLIPTPIQSGPTKDLKTGMKVTATIAGSIFEAVKPELKRVAGNQVRNVLRAFSRNKL